MPSGRPSLNITQEFLEERLDKTVHEIAEELGCSRPTVDKSLKQYGLKCKRKPGSGRPRIKIDEAWVKERYLTQTRTEMAAELGCSTVTLSKAMISMGLGDGRRGRPAKPSAVEAESVAGPSVEEVLGVEC